MRRLALALGALAAYALVIRPRIVRWGATDDEVHSAFPGRDLIPNGKRSSTMAVTIDAPPADVWPWLLQMGYRRAGWYSWDWLDNFGRRSSEVLHPEWQSIKTGDILAGPGATDLERAWEVAALEPERLLSLRASVDFRGRRFDSRGPRPSSYSDSTWSFLLKELPGGKTRLVVSGYWETQPRWLLPIFNATALEWTHWIMQARQFANLKRLAEARGGARRPQEDETAKAFASAT